MLNVFRMLVHPSSGGCDLFVELFRGFYCSGMMCVGVTLWFGWSGVVSGYHEYNPWNNSTNKSQAPEDRCINIRNMLRIKYWNKKASDFKLVSLYSTVLVCLCSCVPALLVGSDFNFTIVLILSTVCQAPARNRDKWLHHMCLSAWNNSAPTWRISVKLDIWGFFDKLSRKKTCPWNVIRMACTLHDCLAELFRIRNVSDTSFGENRVKHTIYVK